MGMVVCRCLGRCCTRVLGLALQTKKTRRTTGPAAYSCPHPRETEAAGGLDANRPTERVLHRCLRHAPLVSRGALQLPRSRTHHRRVPLRITANRSTDSRPEREPWRFSQTV